MKREDKQALERYLARLSLARQAGCGINPFETEAEKQQAIARMKEDVGFLARTLFPHLCLCPSADFQTEFARMVAGNPVFKGWSEWGRGLAKSVWDDIIIPTLLWVRGETHYMCLVSDTFDRACDLLDDLRAEFEGNEAIIHYFGEQKLDGFWEKGGFTTKSGFTAKAFGVRQKVRGLRKGAKRPDLWVIDDLETPQTLKNSKTQDDIVNWIERDVIPTMTGEFRRLIGANNRFAQRMVQTLLRERHPDWVWHLVEAYNPVTYAPRWKENRFYTPEFYRQQERDMGVLAAHSEYNHVAIIEGKIFKNEQIQWAELPDLRKMNAIVGHWDIAYAGNPKSDYNAVRLWGRLRTDFWLLDCYVKQSKMKAAVLWMCEKQREARAAGYIVYWQYEAQFWNDEVQRTIAEAERETGESLHLVKVQTPKVAKLFRLIALQPYYQNSHVYYNAALKSHSDTQVGIRQLLAVEPGMTEHDDAPDADKQAIDTLEKYTTPRDVQQTGDTRSWRTGRMKHKYNL